MSIESVDRHIRALLASIPALKAESPRQITAEGLQIAFCLLDLGLLLRTTGLGDQVHGELVGWGATDEVREVGELQRRGFLLLCRLGLRRCGFRGVRRFAGELCEEGSRLTRGQG